MWLAIFLATLLVLGGCATPPQTATPAPATGAKPAKTLPTPTPQPARPAQVTPPPASPTPATGANITFTAPVAGAKVTSPVRVSGRARVYEAHVELAVKDASGKVIGKGSALATAGAPEWGSFDGQITFEAPRSEQQGVVEAFSISARDGSVQDLVSVKVTLLPK